MSSPITGLPGLQGNEFPLSRTGRTLPTRESERTSADRSEGADFADTFAKAIEHAGQTERTAAETATKFAEGDPNVGIHEAVISAERANISLRYTVTLKNKLVEAYRDIMNTQI